MAPNHSALKRAIFDSGKRQIEIARRAEIHESRLSKLANGYFTPTADEKVRLAKALRVSVSQLFPESVAS